MHAFVSMRILYFLPIIVSFVHNNTYRPIVQPYFYFLVKIIKHIMCSSRNGNQLQRQLLVCMIKFQIRNSQVQFTQFTFTQLIHTKKNKKIRRRIAPAPCNREVCMSSILSLQISQLNICCKLSCHLQPCKHVLCSNISYWISISCLSILL